MRWLASIVFGLALTAQSAAAQPSPEDCSRREARGDRVLCQFIELAAPADEVWALISTAEGWRSWAAPVAAIDLRSGGIIETSYDPAARIGDPANIHNRVLAVAPGRSITIQIANAPPGFPRADLARELTTAIELEPVDARHTRVRITMMGYRAAPGFDDLYAFFERGNAFTLTKLNERIERGPTQWPHAEQQ